MSSLAPLVLFTYNRLEHTRRTVQALRNNDRAAESDLVIYCDGPRNEKDESSVEEVRRFVRSIQGFNEITIFERETNLGLSGSIISGVTEVIGDRGNVIVLEDDHVSSPYFLTFMNEALSAYSDCDSVAAVHGYFPMTRTKLPDTVLLRFVDCWGWGTWSRSWQLFEKDGQKLLDALRVRKLQRLFNLNESEDFVGMLEQQVSGLNDSWAIRWYASAFLEEKLGVFPGRNLIQHIGWDEGTHSADDRNHYYSPLADRPVQLLKCELRENNRARVAIEEFFRSLKPTLLSRIRARLATLFEQNENRAS